MRSGQAIVLSDYIGGDGAGSGGAGHAALDSYMALREAEADVRAVAGFCDLPQEPRSIATLGGRDLRLGSMSDTLRAIYNPAARTALSAELAGHDPDTTLVILHQWTRYLSPAALGVIDRYPTMIYMHDYFWACPNGIYFDFRRNRPCRLRPMSGSCIATDCDRQGRVQKAGRVVRQAARRLTTRADPRRRLFLHLSEGAHRTAAPLLPGERHAILYNPLTLPNLPPTPPQPQFDVGYFGRLEPDKGVAALIEAVVSEGMTALFVGQGSLEPMLARAPGIEHRAWQPRATMTAAMRSCSVVVLPSLWHETWGLIIPEAMGADVPVLVSKRAGSAELVRRFGGGATFDPDCTGDLARKLAAMLATQPAPTARHRELRNFLSPERHAARILSLAQSHFKLDLRREEPSSARASRPMRPLA